MLLRFLSVVLLILTYSAFKLSQLFGLSASAALFAACSMIVFILSPRLLLRRTSDMSEAHFLAGFTSAVNWIGSTLLGVWGTYLMLSIPVDLLTSSLGLFSETISRADAQTLAFAVLALSLVLSLFGLYEVLRGPRVERVEIPLRQNASGLKDLSIVQISDLHIGPTIQGRYVRKVVARVNSLQPDIIVITGDLVDGPIAAVAPHLELLKNMKARLGVFYVSGNHEYYWDFADTMDAIRSLGITVLVNENRVLRLGDASLMIAGVPDPTERKNPPAIAKAVATNENVDFKVLLSHRPSLGPDFTKESMRAAVDLQLSGHTHAGQFFPFSLLIPMAHKQYRGLHQNGSQWLYVNPGTGYWGPANRFAVSAEITQLVLVDSK